MEFINKNKNILQFFSVLLMFLFINFGKELIPIESKFTKALWLFGILLFLILISTKFLLKNGFGIYGLNSKLKTSIKLYAILIGLAIGISTNIIVLYTINTTHLLEGFNILEGILLAGIIGPIVEELLFRGYIQSVISSKFTNRTQPKGFWLTIVITALLFGLLHINILGAAELPQTLAIMIMAFILGIATGYFKEKYKSIVLPIYMHMATNLSSIIILPFIIFLTVNKIDYNFKSSIHKPEYNFDLSDSATFHNSLIEYSIYEKIVPDSLKGKTLHITIPMLLTVDSSGIIIKRELDTICGWYKIRDDVFEKNALIIANRMPNWKVPKNMKKDSTVRFIVSY